MVLETGEQHEPTVVYGSDGPDEQTRMSPEATICSVSGSSSGQESIPPRTLAQQTWIESKFGENGG